MGPLRRKTLSTLRRNPHRFFRQPQESITMSTYTWKPVALHLCLLLRQQGFTLNSADNGEDETATDDTDELVENLVACDEARLYISRPFEFGGTRKLCLYLVLGNEPHETVADYTVDDKLEAALLIFEEFWSRRKTPLAEAEASWVEEVRGCFGCHHCGAGLADDGGCCSVQCRDQHASQTVRPAQECFRELIEAGELIAVPAVRIASERPTPITDAATFDIPCHGADGTGARVAVVRHQVARDLERELVEAREQRDQLSDELARFRSNY